MVNNIRNIFLVLLAVFSEVGLGADSGLKQSTIDSLNAQRSSGRVLSALELKVIKERRLNRPEKLQTICKAHQYTSLGQCQADLFRQASDCKQNDDCVAVIDECGHWRPINKKFAPEFNELDSEIYIGSTPCRWRGPSAVEGNRPKFNCVEGSCTDHQLKGGIKIEKKKTQ